MHTLQARLRKNFGRYGLYQRLRTSLLGDIYRRLSYGDLVNLSRAAVVRFYRNMLQGLRKCESFLISVRMEGIRQMCSSAWARVL